MENTVTKPGFRKKFLGDKAFYKMVLAIAIPIMIQNGITNFCQSSGQYYDRKDWHRADVRGSHCKSAPFLYTIFVCLEACPVLEIFTAQYAGQKDHEGVRQTFRYKLWLVIALTIITILILMCSGENLIGMYLKGEGSAAALEATSRYGMQYLWIMFIGLPPFMISQAYSSTLRECGETVQPMKAGVTAVLVNLVFNYLLIYGKFGFPELEY